MKNGKNIKGIGISCTKRTCISAFNEIDLRAINKINMLNNEVIDFVHLCPMDGNNIIWLII